jgi:hypothetical protein
MKRLFFIAILLLAPGSQAQTFSNAAASGLSVTNLSVLGYQKCVVNWDVPNEWFIAPSQATFTASVVGYHWSGWAGQPLAGVLIWALDQHSHSNGFWVTNLTISPAIYGVPYPHYAATFASSNFNSGDLITLNFAAYPWIGNSASVVNTSDGVNTQPTPLYAPLTWYDNYSNSLYSAIALVDPVNGSDSTGKAQTNANGPFTNGAPFATIAMAVSNCVWSNNIYFGHKDPALSVIFLTNGLSVWTGSSHSTGTNGIACVILTNAGGATASTNGIASTQSGSQALGDRMICRDIMVSNGASGYFITGVNYIIWTNVAFNSTGQATWQAVTNMYFLSCQVTNLKQGITAWSTNPTCGVLVRDCNFDNFTNSVFYWTFVGNSRSNAIAGAASPQLINENITAGQPWRSSSNCIVAFNCWYKLGGTANTAFNYYQNTQNPLNNLWGAAIVASLFESTNGASGLYAISPDGLTNGYRNNLIFWNNTFLGSRLNFGYDEVVSNAATYASYGDVSYVCWSMKGNNVDQLNIKTDIYAGTPDSPAGLRTNNWPIVFMVGASGNVWGQITNIGAGGSFLPGFAGLDTAYTNEAQTPYVSQWSNYFQYVNNASYVGGPGGGNYHLTMASPSVLSDTLSPVPYDLNGLWAGCAPAGAFKSVNPFAANLFFGQ